MAGRIGLIPGGAEYPRDQWYVAAFSREITRGKMLSRTLLDDPVLLYRDREEGPVALFDRCPHRGMPLSLGKIKNNDVVQCAYHGFEFDTQGQCTHIPSQEKVPSSLCVRRYPVVERWRWIWIWMGDPSKADVALIPEHEQLGLTRDAWLTDDTLHLPVNANYLLAFENFADSVHTSFLHEGQLDADAVVARTPGMIEEEGRIVRVTRVFKGERQGEHVGRDLVLDRSIVAESFAPNLVLVTISSVPSSDHTEKPRCVKLNFAITPESAGRTHQFIARAYSYEEDLQREIPGLQKIFAEDVAAIEAIQKLYDRLGPERSTEMHGKADAGHIRTRKMIEQMILAERTESSRAG